MQLRSEALRLRAEILHQFRSHDPSGEAGIILDLGGEHELTAVEVAGEDDGREVGAAGVDGGREAGGAGSDDGDGTVGAGHVASFNP